MLVQGKQQRLWLGNLDAKRDWGHAKDYVEGMWKILQHDQAEDFVLATGKSFTVREFCEIAFKEIDISLEWVGEGINEIGKDNKSGRVLVQIDNRYFRPTEVDYLQGDASKAKDKLNWTPKISLKSMISEMVQNDIESLN